MSAPTPSSWSDRPGPGDSGRPESPGPGEFTPVVGAVPVPGYELVKRLGRGGFGEVWRANGPGGVLVALKFVSLEGGVGKAELRALDVMRQIHHPHLVSLSGIWTPPDLLILAMELGDRTLMDCLNDALARGEPGIAPGDLHEYIREAAKGIDHLNSLGIIHRDVKPKNLLLMGGSVKVSDFGLVKILEKKSETTTGMLTAAYAAPEFIRGEATRYSDQYSLAVTYCHLRGGRLPFVGLPVQLMAAHLNAEPDLSMIPEEERPCVRRAMAKSPDQRWPDCRSFARALAGTTGNDSIEVARVPGPTPKPRGLVRGAVGVAALALVGLVGLVGSRFLSSGSPTGMSVAEVERVRREVSIHRSSRNEPFREHTPGYQMVKELDVSSNPEFAILSDDRVIDLRHWKPVPEAQSRELYSAVVMTRQIRLLKTEPARTVEFQGRTSGFELFQRCLAPYPSQEFGRDFEDFVGADRVRVRKLVIDVSSVPVGQQFDLTLGSCYWNSLQVESDQWFGVMGYEQSYKVSQLILFPPGKPFTSYALKVAKTSKSTPTDFEGERILTESPEKDWIYWEVQKPSAGSVYQLHWKW